MSKYIIIERFKPGKIEEIYQRFTEHGRMLPDGLVYIDSWVSRKQNICFQLMECNNRKLISDWMKSWEDLIAFEIFPVDD